MPTLRDLETPALLLDMNRMHRNCERMRTHLAPLGVTLRPHVKTAKSGPLVRAMLGAASGPVTVSTLREAEACFAEGMTDILYAVGIAPNKLSHVHDLRRRGAKVIVILDEVSAAQAVGEAARASRDPFDVLIEIDADGHRAGVAPGSDVLLTIADTLKASGARLRGVMTHAGESYYARTPEARRAASHAERDAVVLAATRLRAAGHNCDIASVGSTPTALFADDLTGVTEVRAGVYVFQDLVMAGIGVCAVDDIAISVLVSVIGHQPSKGWIITDGGWMALSRDRGTSVQALDQLYGVVCDAEGKPLDDLVMLSGSQEHGIIGRRKGDTRPLPELPVGTLLRVLPNHACATAAAFDKYVQVEGASPMIVGTEKRVNNW
jgi:D-serine deaminase-like pyridoxal phosphate-dependent protein